MAVELGYAYLSGGLYQAGDFTVNTQGMIASEPECWQCNDAGLVKVPPYSRRSVGPWDWEIVTCRCRMATLASQQPDTYTSQREANATTVGQFLAKLRDFVRPRRLGVQSA